MSTKTKLTHVTPDGQMHTRTTARDYEYVVVAAHEPGSYWHRRLTTEGKNPDALFVASWHGRRDLASKKAEQMRAMGFLRVAAEPITRFVEAA